MFVLRSLFCTWFELRSESLEMFPKSITIRRIYSIRKQHIIIVAFTSFVFVYLLLAKLLAKTPWTHVGWKDPDFRFPVAADKGEMIILRWTREWHNYENVQVMRSEDCPYLTTPATWPPTSSEVFDIPCRLTFDRRYLKASDALVFHSFDLMSEEAPLERDPNQPWVYIQRECPIYTKLNLHGYPNAFNWTMTYRRDSDVYANYGHIVPISEADPNEDLALMKSELKSRRNQVAWIVSSCDSHSKREYLVNQLKKYINVDVYGWCGMECPWEGNCYGAVNWTHKFYLSFENALCTDYITEKFFSALRANMIPVVYGGRKSSDYAAIAPNGSYIDAREFKTLKDLADYLIYLDSNDEAYMKYFEWKKTSKVISNQGWCNLCQRVYEYLELGHGSKVSNSSSTQKVKGARGRHRWYNDLWKWWNYMSYDENMTSAFSNVGGSMNSYKLGEPACTPPLKHLTSIEDGEEVSFEPGFRNGAIFWKVAGWVKDAIIS